MPPSSSSSSNSSSSSSSSSGSSDSGRRGHCCSCCPSLPSTRTCSCQAGRHTWMQQRLCCQWTPACTKRVTLTQAGHEPTCPVTALFASLQAQGRRRLQQQQQQQACNAVLLSAAAVRLVLELQLLAADAVQQQQQSAATTETHTLLLRCDVLLAAQIRHSMCCTDEGCLPEVLKEAGLQLLQALAAPVQLQQLSSWQAPSLMISQLYALRGAAEIVIVAEDGTIVVQQSHLRTLAAAHPEAYAALIDCCMRSDQLKPQDMLVAAELLAPAVSAVLSSATLLADTAAVAGLASALTSFMKRAVQFTRTAALIQQQHQPAAAGHDAATNFLAAAPRMFETLLVRPALAAGITEKTSSSQVRASAALLAVVLARSAGQLAAAMEAAV
uniref:Uncharacterized protein n=1 Tax=Tetradesmus obliquus TaxID=3088 RepID=A0A383VLP9_TETOB|eukprot:jgi/Sobl393_1/18589/SZX65326.1